MQGDQPSHVVYRVVARVNNKFFDVWLRFRAFHELDKGLRARRKIHGLPPMPPKVWWGNFGKGHPATLVLWCRQHKY